MQLSVCFSSEHGAKFDNGPDEYDVEWESACNGAEDAGVGAFGHVHVRVDDPGGGVDDRDPHRDDWDEQSTQDERGQDEWEHLDEVLVNSHSAVEVVPVLVIELVRIATIAGIWVTANSSFTFREVFLVLLLELLHEFLGEKFEARHA